MILELDDGDAGWGNMSDIRSCEQLQRGRGREACGARVNRVVPVVGVRRARTVGEASARKPALGQ